jgi:8-oxo-dGTP pyrophosphatase MutT (NUDIX family)
MLRKNSRIAFGGMWVFPGGRIDDEDWNGGDDDIAAARTAAVREAAEETQLSVDPNQMVMFSHWIPPAIAPKRFATWFFAASVAEDTVVIDDGEIVDLDWTTPESCLARHHEGEIELVPPTWVTLHTISGFDSVPALLTSLSTRQVRRYATKVISGANPPIVMWEGDAGYRDGVATVDGLRHRLTMGTEGYVYEDSGAV